MGAATHANKDIRILIIGGGIAGLFCALEFQRQGFVPVILESRGSESLAGMFAACTSAILGILLIDCA